MAVGDCIEYPCGVKLDFDHLLVSLFGVTDYGCVGLKVFMYVVTCDDLEDASICGSAMTLEEIIRASIVEDGCGGYALKVFNVVSSATCLDTCGTHHDVESLFKSLFAKDDTGCFGLKLTQFGGDCEDLDIEPKCLALPTVEQIIRNAIHTDDCGNSLLAYLISGNWECETMNCGNYITADQILMAIFGTNTLDDCGVMKLNYVSGNCSSLTDLVECGTYLTFEQVILRALNATACGPALNVYNINNRQT